MPPQVLAAVATVLSFAPHDNHLDLRLDHGSAELVWITDSTFRFRRTLEGPLPAAEHPRVDIRSVETDEIPGAVRSRSRFLEVTIQRSGVLVRVRRLDGLPLLTDLTEPRLDGGAITWDRRSPPGTRFLGLGPGNDPALDLAGKALSPEEPFLVSSAGYGEYHTGAGSYHFDFTAAGRYTIRSPAVAYYFYYGPTAKQIFVEYHHTRERAASWPATAETPGSWATLRTLLLSLVHGSMSAMSPSVNLAPYATAPAELLARARQIGSLVDDVSPGKGGLSVFRQQLESFYSTYAYELEDKGYPIWHPLPFQFPEDPECTRHADEFMLGDEMLIAPIYEPGGRRSLYLPQGIWTNFDTNERIQGRRSITVAGDALPVFARNGVIVPLDSKAGMSLHYFPKLGAEFFLLETDPDEWSQIHAAPAGDVVRLEIESKRARDYQWVVHHVGRPAQVGFEETRFREAATLDALEDRTWFYDNSRKNLHIRLHVAAGEDSVVTLAAELHP